MVKNSAARPLQSPPSTRPARPARHERVAGGATPPPEQPMRRPSMSNLSYVSPSDTSPWHTYLAQVDRVVPYLGPLGRWAETLKRPKRALVVDVPIEMDDGTV